VRQATGSRFMKMARPWKAMIPALCCVLCAAGCGSEFELLLDKKSGAAADTTPPTVLGTSPVNGASGVTLYAPVAITFSEPMSAEATAGAVSLAPAVTGTTFEWDGTGSILTVGHSSFADGTTAYTVTVGTGAADLNGLAMESPYSFTFTTVETAVEMKIFWSELSGGINKTDTENTEEATVVTAGGTPLDIDLDYAGGMLYWTEDAGSSHEINRADLEGNGEENLYSAPSPFFGPTEIAVDPDSGLIYWHKFQTVSGTSIICSADVSELTDVNCSNDLAYDYTSGIALHPESSELYFSANTTYWDIAVNAASGSGSTGVLYRTSSNIPDLTAYIGLYPATGPEDPSVPLRGIIVDHQSSTGYLFFVIDSNTESDTQIIRSDFDFTSQTVWVTADSFEIQKIALDRAERKIYWTSPSDNGIYRADADTAATGIELFVQGDSAPTGIAVGN